MFHLPSFYLNNFMLINLSYKVKENAEDYSWNYNDLVNRFFF